MIKDEIKTDVEFLKRHDLQPVWWKYGKIAVLIAILAAITIFLDWKSMLVWLGTVLICMGSVHLMYRAKTKKYTVAWADFRVGPGDKKRKFGLLYYPLVVISMIIAFVLTFLVRTRF